MKKKIFILLSILLLNSNCYAIEKWECVESIETCHTWRLWVPDGWILAGNNPISTNTYAMVFVPDFEHSWKL